MGEIGRTHQAILAYAFREVVEVFVSLAIHENLPRSKKLLWILVILRVKSGTKTWSIRQWAREGEGFRTATQLLD